MRPCLRPILIFFCVPAVFATWASAQTTNACLDLPAKQPTCSATGINRSCDLYIDRLRPVVPPTVYLRRGDTVTVHIINASPFESLSLDFKTAGDTTPPDPFENAFQSVNGTVTKMTFVDDVNYSFVVPNLLGPPPDPFAAMRTQLKQAASTQRVLLSEYDPSIVMNEILIATQSPPATACTVALAWDDKGYPNPWLSPSTWSKATISVLTALQKDVLTPAALAPRVNQLDTEVAKIVAYQPPAATPADLLQTWTNAVANLQKRQMFLDNWRDNPPSALAAPTAAIDNALIDAITKLNLANYSPKEQTRVLVDLAPTDHNVTAETWSLDYINNLQTAVKNATATASALGGLSLQLSRNICRF